MEALVEVQRRRRRGREGEVGVDGDDFFLIVVVVVEVPSPRLRDLLRVLVVAADIRSLSRSYMDFLIHLAGSKSGQIEEEKGAGV